MLDEIIHVKCSNLSLTQSNRSEILVTMRIPHTEGSFGQDHQAGTGIPFDTFMESSQRRHRMSIVVIPI